MAYYQSLNDHTPESALKYLRDDITVSEFDYAQVKDQEGWLNQFLWDKAFLPEYSILEMKDSAGMVDAVVSKQCKRIRFLHDTPIVYRVLFEFKGNKISREHTYAYLDFDFEKWESRRESLVYWIDVNYPELSGFIYDQTITGAENYLKAIELYQAR
jgi:hypothetical protein